MSEEINEDNCVLDFEDFVILSEAVLNFKGCLPERVKSDLSKKVDVIFAKIKKLNDLAKGAKND